MVHIALKSIGTVQKEVTFFCLLLTPHLTCADLISSHNLE